MSVIGGTTRHSSQSIYTPVKVPENRLSDDMGNIFDSATFSDVTLCAQDKEFQAHKSILAGERQRIFLSKAFFLKAVPMIILGGGANTRGFLFLVKAYNSYSNMFQ